MNVFRLENPFMFQLLESAWIMRVSMNTNTNYLSVDDYYTSYLNEVASQVVLVGPAFLLLQDVLVQASQDGSNLG